MRTRARRSFYVIVPLGAVAVTLVVLELFLVVFYPIPFSVEKSLYFEPDPFTGYRPKPNSRGFFQGSIPARVNNQGQRDEFVSLKKPLGTFRILALGDSFTMGSNVEEDDAYPEVLEEMLQSSRGPRVEVVNAGVGGWSPFQYAQYFEQYGRSFSPDLILVGFFVGNDTYFETTDSDQLRTAVLGRRVSKEAASSPFIQLKVLAYDRLNLGRLLLNRSATVYSANRESCSEHLDWVLNLQRRKLSNHRKRSEAEEARVRPAINQIDRIRSLATEDGIPIVIILIPDENQINQHLQKTLLSSNERGQFDFEMPQSMLQEIWVEAALPVIDLLPAFRSDPRCLFLNDTHWTAEGHELAASVISHRLRADNLVPER